MSVALIILTLNEIDGIKVIMPRVKQEWVDEIIFVDGGSTDGTVEEAKKLGFKVIHQTNKGSGNACRIGVEKTNSDYVIFFHPDGNHVPEDIPKLIEKMHEGHYTVHISRFGKNSINEDASTLDIFGNKLFTFLVNVFFGGHLTDALTGLILIKKEIMLDLKTDAKYFEIEEQMCIRALKKNYPIYEVESNEPKRIGGKTKVRPLNVGSRLSWTIIKEFIFWNF